MNRISKLSSRGGSSRSKTEPQPNRPDRRIRRYMFMLGICFATIFACLVGLRLCVAVVSNEAANATTSGSQSRSGSKTSELVETQLDYEQIRETARQQDRQWLRRRNDAIWHDQHRDRPGPAVVYERWNREVVEIEQQILVAEKIEAEQMEADRAAGETMDAATAATEIFPAPPIEDSLLWHRKQRLKELKADAPRSDA